MTTSKKVRRGKAAAKRPCKINIAPPRPLRRSARLKNMLRSKTNTWLLLGYPCEIRMIIFQHLFSDLNIRLFHKFPVSCNSLEILLVSRQIYVEVTKMLVQQISFKIDVPLLKDAGNGVFPTWNIGMIAESFALRKIESSGQRRAKTPVAGQIRELNIQLHHVFSNFRIEKIRGYPEAYMLFPKLRRLHINMMILSHTHVFPVTVGEDEVTAALVESLTADAFAPLRAACRSGSLKTTISIGFSYLTGQWLQRYIIATRSTICIAQIEYGQVESLQSGPLTETSSGALSEAKNQLITSFENVVKEV